MNSAVDIVDIALWILGVISLLYVRTILRRRKFRSWIFLLSGIILSSLIGYGWFLLSIFIFPLLAGADFDYSPEAQPLPFIAQVSLRQAIPSGIVFAALGVFMTCRLYSKNVTEQVAASDH